MKNTHKLFIPLILFLAVSAFSQITIYSHKNVGQEWWIDPCVRIVNSGTARINLRDYTVHYYFYNTRYPAYRFSFDDWYFSGLSSVSGTNIAYDPPFTDGPKKANIECKISFSGAATYLDEGDYAELEFGIHDPGWYSQDQDNDWSYMPGQDWELNTNIVVKDQNGNIIFGNEPGEIGIQKDPVPVNWIGEWSSDSIQLLEGAGLVDEGDAYKNTTDGISYVYYKGNWQEIGGSGGSDAYKNGWTMNNEWCDIDMNGAAIGNANYLRADFIKGDALVIVDPIPEQKPAIPNPVVSNGAFEGTVTYYEDGGEWYIYVKVDGDPPTWRRVKLDSW